MKTGIAFLINLIAIVFIANTKVHAQAACIVLNEFTLDPATGNNGDASRTGEFVELYNKCTCPQTATLLKPPEIPG